IPDSDESTILNRVQEMRTLANYQSDEIVLAIQENRIDDAIAAIRVQLRHGEPLEGCPSAIFELVRAALISVSTSQVQVLLAHAMLTPSQLTKLQAILQSYDRFDP